MKPTASITGTLGGKAAKDCDGRKCVYRGGRKVAISWTTDCNVSDPDVSRSVSVSMMGRPKAAGATPLLVETLVNGSEDPNGTGQMVVPAGTRVFLEVEVWCSYSSRDAEGNYTTHTGKSTAITGDFFLPPALAGYEITRNHFCGNVPDRYFQTRVQAGGYAVIEYDLDFSALSMLGKNTVAAHAAGVRLYAQNGGKTTKRKPDRGMLRKGGYETYLNPRRGGTMKLWATIGGVKTNTLKIKVLPKKSC